MIGYVTNGFKNHAASQLASSRSWWPISLITAASENKWGLVLRESL
jgi:hypothetical protein